MNQCVSTLVLSLPSSYVTYLKMNLENLGEMIPLY